MRYSSGRASALACAAALLSVSCALAPPRTATEETFTVEGRLIVEGAHPFDRVILVEDADGLEWPLDAGGLDYEMSLLEGHIARVTCVSPGIHEVEGRLKVAGYTLVPIDGMTPLRGVIVHEDGAPALYAGEETVLLTGPLSEVVGEWTGHDAWVWGGEEEPPDIFDRAISVSGFEVLGRKD